MVVLLASLAPQTGFSLLKTVAKTGTVAAATIDEFGIKQLYPEAPGSTSWNSLHWDNGRARRVDSVRDTDPDDPTQWSMMRGRGSIMFDGNGIMTLSGPQPRIYLSHLGPADLPNKFWKNVEATVYYQRVRDDSTNWGGIVIGTRSGRDGHISGSTCSASTYYGRIRNDGKMDFQKELQHPRSQVRESRYIWGGDPLPFNQWIGMKLVVRNTDNDQRVRLELYRDLTEGVNGGTWEKLGEYTDAGGWSPDHDCGFESDRIITDGGGVVFIRNTGVEEANYKWFSVREIAAASD